MKQRIFKLDVPEYEQIPEFMKILDDLSVGNNVFLVGPAGTGKSTLARLVVYSFFNRAVNDGKELPFVKINCNQWTSPTDIKGGQTIEGYREGGLIEAWRDGKILILDDAFSSLDIETEAIILRNIQKITRSLTTIIITHRLTVTRQVDQILVMEHGRIVERGNHEELIKNEGLYQRMYTNQVLAREMEILLQ